MNFTFNLSSESLATISSLSSKAAQLKNAKTAAMAQLGKKIAENIPNYMDWKNPTGKLESSFSFRGNEVGSDLPYARRREFSFKGPDKLGRMFPNDPAAFYMEQTLGNLTDEEVTEIFITQLDTLFGN